MTQSKLDAFDDWSDLPADEVGQFESSQNTVRRLTILIVTWRGVSYRFDPDDRLLLGQHTNVTGLVCLWPPTTESDHPWPRSIWTADVLVYGYGFVEATGPTPQAALDALNAELPPGPMVRGGSC